MLELCTRHLQHSRPNVFRHSGDVARLTLSGTGGTALSDGRVQPSVNFFDVFLNAVLACVYSLVGHSASFPQANWRRVQLRERETPPL